MARNTLNQALYNSGGFEMIKATKKSRVRPPQTNMACLRLAFLPKAIAGSLIAIMSIKNEPSNKNIMMPATTDDIKAPPFYSIGRYYFIGKLLLQITGQT